MLFFILHNFILSKIVNLHSHSNVLPHCYNTSDNDFLLLDLEYFHLASKSHTVEELRKGEKAPISLVERIGKLESVTWHHKSHYFFKNFPNFLNNGV